MRYLALSTIVEVEACVPESDDDLCIRLSATCGELTAPDNCGDERTVASCGTCATGTCGGGGSANVCGATCT